MFAHALKFRWSLTARRIWSAYKPAALMFLAWAHNEQENNIGLRANLQEHIAGKLLIDRCALMLSWTYKSAFCIFTSSVGRGSEVGFTTM